MAYRDNGANRSWVCRLGLDIQSEKTPKWGKNQIQKKETPESIETEPGLATKLKNIVSILGSADSLPPWPNGRLLLLYNCIFFRASYCTLEIMDNRFSTFGLLWREYGNQTLSIFRYLICAWLILTDGRNCRQCDKVLRELENIDDETDHFGELQTKWHVTVDFN